MGLELSDSKASQERSLWVHWDSAWQCLTVLEFVAFLPNHFFVHRVLAEHKDCYVSCVGLTTVSTQQLKGTTSEQLQLEALTMPGCLLRAAGIMASQYCCRGTSELHSDSTLENLSLNSRVIWWLDLSQHLLDPSQRLAKRSVIGIRLLCDLFRLEVPDTVRLLVVFLFCEVQKNSDSWGEKGLSISTKHLWFRCSQDFTTIRMQKFASAAAWPANNWVTFWQRAHEFVINTF